MITDTEVLLWQRRPTRSDSFEDVSSSILGRDLFAHALAERGARGPLEVEREGVGLYPTSLLWWLREAGQPNPVDFASIELVREGPVLDVGCATGRHIEALTATGIEAVGIDINPEAVRLAHLNHCLVTHDDIWSIESQRRYRWILALGNNIGIAGRLAVLPKLLRQFSTLLLPGGQVLLSSVDSRSLEMNDTERSSGYPGEMRLRHHYDGRVGDWFDWLYVDPDTLAHVARGAGFRSRVLRRFDDVYTAVLTRA